MSRACLGALAEFAKRLGESYFMLEATLPYEPRSASCCAMPVRDALIKSGFEGDGLQAVRKYNEIVAALAAEGLRCDLIRTSLTRGCPVRTSVGGQSARNHEALRIDSNFSVPIQASVAWVVFFDWRRKPVQAKSVQSLP